MHLVVVSARHTAAQARTTVDSALELDPGASVHVLDVDGTYTAAGPERVLTLPFGDLTLSEVHRLAARSEPDETLEALRPRAVRALAASLPPGTVLVSARPGVLLRAIPTPLLAAAGVHGIGLAARCRAPLPADGTHPDQVDLAERGSYSTAIVAVRGDATDALADWASAATTGVQARWADAAAARLPGAVATELVVLSAWSVGPQSRVTGPDPLLLDGEAVHVVDLSSISPSAPWLLDPSLPPAPRARLSDHAVLAALTGAVGARQARLEETGPEAAWSLRHTADGLLLDEALRRALDAQDAPDPFDPAQARALLDWLTSPSSADGLGRYLSSLRSVRPDLVAAFPAVPGADTPGYLAWVAAHAVADGQPEPLVRSALDAARPSLVAPPSGRPVPGVTVLGFLRGGLGIGESARLLTEGLEAAGVPYATVSVDRHMVSVLRTPGVTGAAVSTRRFDTSVLCVNADLTPAVAAECAAVLDRTYRIGMWYWEVEDFPVSQHGGFASVDEVWVATDFVRDAIAPRSPVPVVTVTPPLPQRRALPTRSRADLHLPDGPLLLFSFDHLSTLERKNPIGVLDAFSRAVPPGSGPTLVLKSINAEQRPADAERLRLAVADRPDVLLLEDFLSPDDRDSLVAACDVYVSLHRSEGLGLTMAEAMAWGKPVIATGYSGNLQFMSHENSYLVPWTPGTIPADAAPYPAGGRWAEPDLDAAAALIRRVLDDPAEAVARGHRAAADIARLHSPQAAGERVAARLDALRARRRVAATLPAVSSIARRARLRLGR
ncbi:glycosyltransferase [Cellulomonas soli]|uniref:Glycosyl transferase n=1 Tax=Cellulomonas soli TaxID=931535 RepID=A0A512P803_9CELL|nr:glycosyltransferase [Cellulomonas soli]NYI57548.1 glycosyltransferase involved in cell wall biosynthesis [Cellulomonas soli]GEP67325.1 glycosyl transferase [Cellulomonas soli]